MAVSRRVFEDFAPDEGVDDKYLDAEFQFFVGYGFVVCACLYFSQQRVDDRKEASVGVESFFQTKIDRAYSVQDGKTFVRSLFVELGVDRRDAMTVYFVVFDERPGAVELIICYFLLGIE